MDEFSLIDWQKKLKISPVEIVREELEILILNQISRSSFSKKIVFKGGTALRLCHGSPRFSQDLDFTALSQIKKNELQDVLNQVVSAAPEIHVKEVINKRFTLFSLLTISSSLLKQNFSIKIEITKKKHKFEKNDYSLLIARSALSPLTPLLYVYSLKRILEEKLIAIKTREAPRDYFDIWFISQKLNEKIKIPKPKILPSRFKGEISQLLPDNLKNWPRDFMKSYE